MCVISVNITRQTTPPSIGQFYNQNPDDKIEIGAFPIVNVYANLHLKRTRFFIMMYHSMPVREIPITSWRSLPNQSANDKVRPFMEFL